MICVVRTAIRAAMVTLAMTVASWASAQATFARGESLWTATNATVAMTECTSCHGGSGPALGNLRVTFAANTQAEIRARIDAAFLRAPMAGLFTAMVSNDRDSLAIFLGNFIGVPSSAAAPTALTALSAAVGATGSTTLTITNIGRLPLTFAAVSGFAFSGAYAGDFSRISVGTGCDTQTINPGANCQESIRFTPPMGATGTRSATLTITHDGSLTTTALAVSGTVGTSAPPATGDGRWLAAGGGNSGGGALWLWSLLLLAAASARRRHLH